MATLAKVRSTVEPKVGGVVKVPQSSGSVLLTIAGQTVLTKTVTTGQITAADDTERALLLAFVPGATL
jgi:hypothetical protein